MDTERFNRLTNVLSSIDANKKNEKAFDELYQLLQNEYFQEGGSLAENKTFYNKDLQRTITKQADIYMETKKKRPVKGAPSEFEDFTSNFRHDVSKALGAYRNE